MCALNLPLDKTVAHFLLSVTDVLEEDPGQIQQHLLTQNRPSRLLLKELLLISVQ